MNSAFRIVIGAIGLLALAGCSDADVASTNLSKAADNFEVNRRITFINGITGEIMLTMQGLCSLGNFDDAGQLTVTCKTGPGEFKKNFLGLSDNVTFVAEQLEPVPVGTYFYQVNFKPSVLIPDFKVR
jgi:hypothetical protein